MSKELALILANKKWITRWQLENAIQAQLLYDGSLLTNLIKLGYIEEADALKFSSSTYSMPIIKPDMLGNILPKIIDLSPKDLVYKERILPVGVRDSALLLAVSYPPSETLKKDMNFFFGMKIKFLLCYERDLIHFIQYYYAITIQSKIKKDLIENQFQSPDKQFDPKHNSEVKDLTDKKTSSNLSDSKLAQTEPWRNSNEIAEQAKPTTTKQDFNKLVDILAESDNRNEIIENTCYWLNDYFAFSAFFTVKASQIQCFFAAGKFDNKIEIKKFAVSMTEQSSFFEAIDKQQAVFGKNDISNDLQEIRNFFDLDKSDPDQLDPDQLDPALASNHIVIPIILRQKAIGILLGMTKEKQAENMPLDFYNDAAKAVSRALETLILSQKIGV